MVFRWQAIVMCPTEVVGGAFARKANVEGEVKLAANARNVSQSARVGPRGRLVRLGPESRRGLFHGVSSPFPGSPQGF